MATTKAVLAQLCIRCGIPGAFPCRGCRQYWYCSKACYLQHYAHGHSGQCKLLQEQGKTSSTQIESTPEQNEECLKPLLRTPSRTLFDPTRLRKLLNFRLPLLSEDALPSGLINAGNTCFVSAVLQSLVNTHPLQVYLTSSEHLKEKCHLSGGKGELVKIKGNFCPICHLKDIVALMLDPRYSAIMPRDLLLNLDKIGEFRLGDQEDAHQFLLDMLFKLHDAFVNLDAISRKLASATDSKPVNHGPNAKKSTESKNLDFTDPLDRQLIEETSFVYQMFGGRYLHKTRCIECGRVSMNPEPFLVLSLGLAECVSIEESLRNHCKVEVIPKGDESLVCDTCQRRVTVQRQTTFWQAPEILVVHLKRFDNSGKKINKSVAFSQTIDFTDVISRDSPHAAEGQTTYSLYSSIVHYGPFMGAGHYVAFGRMDGKWYLFDDKSVYGINESIVMKQNAYILFYKKNPPTTPAVPTNLRTSNPAGAASSSSSPSPLTTSSDTAVVAPTLAISHLTPPCTAYLAQDDDVMKDVTLRIHLPQLESLRMKDLLVSLTPSGRFELKSPVYYVLLELVFPLETEHTKCVYYEQDRTLVVFAPIAQNPVDSSEPTLLTCTLNSERMSEDDFIFNEEATLPVEPIVGIEDIKTEEEEKIKKGQEKIEALNIETATYKELHANIRELNRNPQRMDQSSQSQQQQQQAQASGGAKKTGVAGTSKRVKPNEPCPCGSGRKYKVCHGK